MKIVADQAWSNPARLLLADGAQGPRRFRPLQELRRPQGHEGGDRRAGHRHASALNEALKKGGLKYGDVDVVYIGFPEHLPTYKNKGIDASITNEPTMTRAIEDGVAVRVAGNDITYPDQQTAVTFYAETSSGTGAMWPSGSCAPIFAASACTTTR